MILYKNVDLIDLISIMEKGILPLDECENNNWEEGKRADNRTDVVYLFSPSAPEVKNSFINYGLALLEVDIESATENELTSCDVNAGKYTEYITDKVSPEQIKAIYLPDFLKERIIDLDNEDKLLPNYPITWCHMDFSEWDRPFTPDRLKIFADTANLSTSQINYFRGVDERRHMIDIDKDHIVYEI